MAFHQGEIIEVETNKPDASRPEYKYVVLSKSLDKRFRLSDGDLTQPPPSSPV